MGLIKEIKDLKCPGHGYLQDNCTFIYEVPYASFRAPPETPCNRCGEAMSMHEIQKII